jgi:hypothetical protein
MFFVSWGTKSRVRSLGDRAEFCPGCLQPTRFTVKSLQMASHLYGIPLGYSNGTSFGECTICGARIEPMFDDALVPVGTLSYESLLGQTNPRLTPQRIEVLLDVAGDRKMRLEQSLRYFLAKQEAVLMKERGQLGGGTLFAILALLILVLCAFHGGGVVIGTACAAIAVAAVALAHSLGVRHRASRVILPNLKRFLPSQGVSFGELEQKLQGEKSMFSKLRRHLASNAYDAMRMDPASLPLVSDDVASLFFKPSKQASLA